MPSTGRVGDIHNQIQMCLQYCVYDGLTSTPRDLLEGLSVLNTRK